jgi:hypothetical protein
MRPQTWNRATTSGRPNVPPSSAALKAEQTSSRSCGGDCHLPAQGSARHQFPFRGSTVTGRSVSGTGITFFRVYRHEVTKDEMEIHEDRRGTRAAHGRAAPPRPPSCLPTVCRRSLWELSVIPTMGVMVDLDASFFTLSKRKGLPGIKAGFRDQAARTPRSVCARLYVVRAHQSSAPRRLLPRRRASSKSRR